MDRLLLYNKYKNYVYKLTKNYNIPSAIEFQDLVQEGHTALLSAIDDYILNSVSCNVSSYLHERIRASLHNHAKANTTVVNTSTYIVEIKHKYETAKMLYPDLTHKEVISLLNIPKRTEQSLLIVLGTKYCSTHANISSNTTSAEGESLVIDLISDDKTPSSEDLVLKEERLCMHKALKEELIKNSTPNAAKVLKLYEQGLTLREIGERKGVKKQAIDHTLGALRRKAITTIQRNKKFKEFYLEDEKV